MKRAAVLAGLGLLGICAGIVAQNQPPVALPVVQAPPGSSMPEPNPSAPKASPMKPQTASMLKQLQDLWHASRTPEDFRSVGHGFEALLKSDPTSAEIRVDYADLLAERFNAADAESLYLEALKLDPNNADAYMGLAELYADGFDEHSEQAAKAALEIDPKRYHADEIMGRMALEDSNYDKAAQLADAALAINPEAVEAIAIHATIDLLDDKSADAWVSKIGNRGEGYADIAKELVINRRYEDGVAFYRKAIAANPQLWSAHSQLGVNLMRLGRNEEAHSELEFAYDNGYADAATANTLQLMESYKNYQTFTWPSASPDGPQPAGILKLDQKEAAALRPYFEAEMKKAMATYEQKYGYKMTKPVQVEVYRRENDFGVRVMGLPGVGLLGVTFNSVVAMDGPSSRSKQEGYHWASVLWHELSHVYTIAMTNERIPRWFTEGVAVHEESATIPDWGDRLNPTILAAIRDKKLLPIADMDRGFVHPTYPDQVIVSYFQAGKICDYIVKRWGNAKLVDIIHAFAKNQPTVDVIREQLKIEPEQFDKDFLADLDAQTSKTVAGFADWTKELRELNTDVKENKAPSDLVERARKLETIYPEYVEAGNPYVLAGDALLKAGDKAGAMAEYAKYSKIGGRDLETMEKYADLLANSGDKKAAVAALWRMIYCFPLDAGLHEKLGNLDLETGANPDAVREFEVLVDLNPDDKAGSHYNLARAFKANGQTDKAREEAITALEAAPDYRPAQKLLLEVSGEDGKTP